MSESYEIKTKCMLCINVSTFSELAVDAVYLQHKLGEIAKSKICKKCKTLEALVIIKITKQDEALK